MPPPGRGGAPAFGAPGLRVRSLQFPYRRRAASSQGIAQKEKHGAGPRVVEGAVPWKLDAHGRLRWWWRKPHHRQRRLQEVAGHGTDRHGPSARAGRWPCPGRRCAPNRLAELRDQQRRGRSAADQSAGRHLADGLSRAHCQPAWCRFQRQHHHGPRWRLDRHRGPCGWRLVGAVPWSGCHLGPGAAACDHRWPGACRGRRQRQGPRVLGRQQWHGFGHTRHAFRRGHLRGRRPGQRHAHGPAARGGGPGWQGVAALPVGGGALRAHGGRHPGPGHGPACGRCRQGRSGTPQAGPGREHDALQHPGPSGPGWRCPLRGRGSP